MSFSANDAIGHMWGPDSQEVLDVTLRSDLVVEELLAYLDAKVGKGRYVLAITADHGVCPLPETSRSQGKEARRLAPASLLADAEAFLAKSFGKGPNGKAKWIAATANFDVYLNLGLIEARGLERAKVEDALAGYFRGQPGVLTAYTRTQLSGSLPEVDAIGQRVRRSFHPERSGDVTIVLQPYWLSSRYPTGTTHGTPHSYDTYVPLLVYGPGVWSGVRKDPVTPEAIAAIFARVLGIRPPVTAAADVPEGLIEPPAGAREMWPSRSAPDRRDDTRGPEGNKGGHSELFAIDAKPRCKKTALKMGDVAHCLPRTQSPPDNGPLEDA